MHAQVRVDKHVSVVLVGGVECCFCVQLSGCVCPRVVCFFFFFSSRRRHTRWPRDWSSDVCSSDLFRYEEELLAPLSAEEIERVYLRTLMPLKLKMEIDYLREARFFSDLVIIFKTAGRIFKRQKHVDEK